MHKRDMSATQQRDWQVFNLILECFGWEDVDGTEARLDSGEFVKPEGLRARREGHISLEAKLHSPVNMISLRITDTASDDNVQIHFLYTQRPERILEWVVEQGPSLSLDTYHDLIKGVSAMCEMILLEKSDMEIYEVKPSGSKT